MKFNRSAYEATARRGATHVLGADAIPFAPARMSNYAHWYEDAQHASLVAVVTPGENPAVADEILAYGLAWQHNRDLLLLLPETMVAATLTRLAWVQTEVRLFQFEGTAGQDPHPVPGVGRFQLFSHLRDLPARTPKQAVLKDGHQLWLEGIALDEAGLTAHDRGGYLSWHHEGLQILQVAETNGGLRIRAGVQYKTPPPGREVFDKTFTTSPTPGEVAVINAKVALAVEDGGSLTSQMREHKMQATLIGQADVLGLTHMWREFPAWRGLTSSSYSSSGRPGFIDFLGADAAGHLHVVETKIGHDPKVVLQALDYAIWVKANDETIRARLKEQGHLIPTPPTNPLTASSPAPMHLVLGAGESGPAFNAYLASQIEALAGDCKVSIYLTAEPTAAPLALTRLPCHDMWEPSPLVAKPVVGPRWPGELTAALSNEDK